MWVFVVLVFIIIFFLGFIYLTIKISYFIFKQIISLFAFNSNKNNNLQISVPIKVEHLPQKQEKIDFQPKVENIITLKEKPILPITLTPIVKDLENREELTLESKEEDIIVFDEKTILADHNNLSNREFRKKYSEDIKIIEILDGFEKEKPSFETSSTGKYIAVKIYTIKYLVFYSKGTNITSENHSVSLVFNLDREIEKTKIYENWREEKPALFTLHNDSSWTMQEKGFINLDTTELPKIINKETDFLYDLCQKHYISSNEDFLKQFLSKNRKILRLDDKDTISKSVPIFKLDLNGDYYAVKIPVLNDDNFFVFYKKYDSKEDSSMIHIFDFNKVLDENKSYDNWRIIKPAEMCKINGKFTLINKGVIDFLDDGL